LPLRTAAFRFFAQSREFELDIVRSQILRESRREFAAGDRQLQRLVRFKRVLIEHARDHRAEQQGPEQRSEQQR